MTALTLSASVSQIDRQVAGRRTGTRTKGPPAADVLEESLGIATVEQLLRHYPYRYIDRSKTASIRALKQAVRPPRQGTLVGGEAEPAVRIGQDVTVIGTVSGVRSRRTRRGQTMVTLTVTDGSGSLELPFFNQPWIARMYPEGAELAVSGRVGVYRGALQLQGQEIEVLRGEEGDTIHTGRIIPVHRATEGVTPRTIRELVHRALQQLGPIPEPLPPDVLDGEDLADEDRALRWIHFPQDERERRAAVDRLKFDELFTLELGVAYRKRRLERTAAGIAHEPGGDLAARFVGALPFEPTEAQLGAMKEISGDMAASRPMHRLLQGDVGSGKTAVALHAAMVAIQSGHQATIMAPTEVLAGQHLRNMAAFLEPLGGRNVLDLAADVEKTDDSQLGLFDRPAAAPDEEAGEPPGEPTVVFGMLTASVTGRNRRVVLDGVRDGTVDLVVGTHALVQEGVEFADLSLAVIDEQHRFGVHQRVLLKEKGAFPDVLIMTATPIPRTLALTYYGDLDVSVLDELPAGRQPVDTRVVRSDADRLRAYGLVREEAQAGRQAFVVCAAIDEGNRLEVRAAEKEAERLAAEVFPDLRIELLHGKMRPADKESRMDLFRAGDADVLIATTVIEVGVDVANATVMLVENAERFGLAQLHQLRGRIGRGEHRSFCVLFDESAPDNADARARLAAMERTTDGFELADEDLRLRGEGTLFDIKQSGMPDLKLARLAEDAELVKRARFRAFAVVDADPQLDAHPDLLRLLRSAFAGEAIEWLFHG